MPAPVQQNFGPQLAGILYSLTGLSTSQGSTTAYTCTSAGVYEFNATVVTTTAGSAGTVLVALTALKGGTSTSGTASLTTLGTNAAAELSAAYLSVGDTVTYTTTVAGNVGGQYQVLVNGNQIQ